MIEVNESSVPLYFPIFREENQHLPLNLPAAHDFDTGASIRVLYAWAGIPSFSYCYSIPHP